MASYMLWPFFQLFLTNLPSRMALERSDSERAPLTKSPAQETHKFLITYHLRYHKRTSPSHLRDTSKSSPENLRCQTSHTHALCIPLPHLASLFPYGLLTYLPTTVLHTPNPISYDRPTPSPISLATSVCLSCRGCALPHQ